MTRRARRPVPGFLLVGFLLLASLGPGLAGCPNEEDGCPIGSETCTCTGGGACDPGLACLSGLCVRLDAGTDADVLPDETVGEDADGGADEGTDSGADDWMTACSPGDECRAGSVCATTSLGAAVCTTACAEDRDCYNHHASLATRCVLGFCWPTCLTAADCPGATTCHLETLCLLAPTGACGDDACDGIESPLNCSDDCGTCGNGRIDPGEQCDGADLGLFECTDLGYGGGVLRCYPAECMFDARDCRAM